MTTLLTINNYHYRRGGAEVVFLEQNRLFRQLGWRVIPFAMRHPDNLPSEWADYFVEEVEFGREYGMWDSLRRAPKIIYSVEARRNVARLLREVRPAVAHAHNVAHHLSPSMFGLLKARGIPVVLTLHDPKLACPAYKMLASDGICERCKGGRIWNVIVHRCIKDSVALSTLIFVESAIHRLAGLYSRTIDRFVVPSRFLIGKFVEWGWDRARFTYIPNFIDPDAYAPSPRPPGNAFVYFGRLVPEKGGETLIRAAALAGVSLRIVGAGPDEARLRRLAADLRVDADFLGHRVGEALHESVRTARATVLPSVLYENAPMSVLESYALGRPVIGADIGGIPELIREGETGALFESGNAEALAGVLRRFIELPDADVAAMGHAGRTWAAGNFDPISYRDRLLRLYRGLGVSA